MVPEPSYLSELSQSSQDAQEESELNEYWNENIPWSFRDVSPRPSLAKRSEVRYGFQDYMHRVIGFKNYGGKSILEVGCGAGIDSVEFAKAGATVTAIDTSPLAIQETEAAFIESGMKPKAIIQGDITQIDFAEKFDLIYSFGVLHHIPEVQEVLQGIRRNLKPGGEFIGMFYNRDSILYAYSLLHEISIERTVGVPYVHPYTKEELTLLLNRFFSEVNISTHYNVIDFHDVRKIKLDIPDYLGLGWHHIARCIP